MSLFNTIVNAVSSVSQVLSTPTPSEQDNVTFALEGDWTNLFMPEPIVGGTNNIEEMYIIDSI